MRFKKLLALLLAAVMVLSLVGCTETPTPSTTPSTEPSTTPSTAEPTTVPTEPTPADLYAAAVEKLSAVTDMSLTVKTSRTLAIQDVTYKESAVQKIYYAGRGTDAFAAYVTDATDMGLFDVNFVEYYHEGSLYTTLNNTYSFKGAATADEFIARYAPPVLLDASLYSDIFADGDTIHFEGATAGETWIVPDYAELVEASGTAVLSADNDLQNAGYTVTYAIGGAKVTWTVEMTVDSTSAVSISEPDTQTEYLEMEFPDAAGMLYRALGYLYQAYEGHPVTTTTAECTISQAAGFVLNQSTTLNSYGSGNSYMADMDTSIYQMTVSGQDSYKMTEHFQKNKYTLSENGSEPEEYSVTRAAFQNYCLSTMIANIPSLDLLEDATAEDLGSVYYLELIFSEEMGESMNESVCSMLWEDPQFLNDLSDEYRTEAMEVYFAVDKFTGLPTAIGYYYEGYHTIESYDYMLSVQLDQSFDLASADAYEAIAEEAPPVEEPEEKATPLFYHVTGPDGQEMWLLGTIHIGDARTSYLPQEIYDAFDAADALAVEFNSEAFYDELEENEELSDQVSESYFFSDGSTVDQHIEDQELFEYAEKMMKATGNYHMNMPYMRAYVWSNSIDNFYLRQTYDLSSTQGVDNQLIWRAESMDKTILDVESGLFQIQMVTGFSDALQELLLLESVASDPLEYINGSHELFEMWCAGDEAALIAYLNDDGDPSELTEEQQKLLDEYNTAMSDDRNVDMLSVAQGYLESGDVVFFAVGLAHLLAEDGLVNTLRDAGYTVELVTFE